MNEIEQADDRDDSELLSAFSDATLPLSRWTHRAHLRIAFLYLVQLPFDEAVEAMRRGIRRYNAAHNVADGPESGYHETVTVAWMRLVAEAMTAGDADGGCASSAAFLDRHADLLRKGLLRDHYSRGRLASEEAKRSFVPPDITPLP